MSHGSSKKKPLVPITREFLRQFYQKYPLEPVPVEAQNAHQQSVEALGAVMLKPGSKVPELFGMPTPTRIDDCFWRNRMICEELALSISRLKTSLGASSSELAASCDRMHSLLTRTERDIFAVQEHNTASVRAQLQQFIPQDFRGALLETKRTMGEARYKKQVEDLVRKGGSIRAKYDLCLQHQWERRQSLVQLGECSGMYKMVIKYMAGIPQVLLDFAKEINAKLGPMEEQRIKYGPCLYGATTLGLRLDVALAAWAENVGAPAAKEAAPKLVQVVEPAVLFYCDQMLRVIRFIGNVFQHSPFFVNKEDLDKEGHHNGDGGAEHAGGSATSSVAPAAAAAVAVIAAAPATATAVAATAGGHQNGEKAAAPLAALASSSTAAAGGGGAPYGLQAAGSSGVLAPATPAAAAQEAGRAPLSMMNDSMRGSGLSAAGGHEPAAAAAARHSNGSGNGSATKILGLNIPPIFGRRSSNNKMDFAAAATGAAATAAPPAPVAAAAAQGAPSPRSSAPSPLTRHDTPSPSLLVPSPSGGGLTTPAAALMSSSHSGHHHHHHHARNSNTGGAARTSIAGDSVGSFTSAEENAPWQQHDDGAGAGAEEEHPHLFLGCFKFPGGGASGSAGAGHGGAAAHGGMAAHAAEKSDPPLNPIAEVAE